MYIYLAHPIDFVTCEGEPIAAYADQARDALLTYGANTVYTPSMAFTARYPMNSAIQDINMYAISKADAMLMFLPTGVHTLGVPFELGYAYAMELPVVIVRGATAKDSAQAREESALLSWLDTPMYSFEDMQFAAMATLRLASKRYEQTR